MATTTTRGYPKPEPADPIKDGATTVAALADSIESKVKQLQSGTVTLDIITVGVAASVTVNFPTPFPAGVTPQCFAGPITSQSTRQVWVTGRTNTSITIAGINTATNADIVIDWFARG